MALLQTLHQIVTDRALIRDNQLEILSAFIGTNEGSNPIAIRHNQYILATKGSKPIPDSINDKVHELAVGVEPQKIDPVFHEK